MLFAGKKIRYNAKEIPFFEDKNDEKLERFFFVIKYITGVPYKKRATFLRRTNVLKKVKTTKFN